MASWSELVIDANKIDGTDYQIRYRETKSPYIITAIHGGAIEVGTSEVADYIAGDEHSFYTFEGIQVTNNFTELHASSNFYDEPIVQRLVANSERCISLHNRSTTGETPIANIGGKDIPLRNAIWKNLNDVGIDAILAPPSLLGTNPLNICNRTLNGEGVQIEFDGFSTRLFPDGDTSGAVRRSRQRTEFFYTACNAIKKAIKEHEYTEKESALYNFPLKGSLKNVKGNELLSIDKNIKNIEQVLYDKLHLKDSFTSSHPIPEVRDFGVSMIVGGGILFRPKKDMILKNVSVFARNAGTVTIDLHKYLGVDTLPEKLKAIDVDVTEGKNICNLNLYLKRNQEYCLSTSSSAAFLSREIGGSYKNFKSDENVDFISGILVTSNTLYHLNWYYFYEWEFESSVPSIVDFLLNKIEELEEKMIQLGQQS